MSPGTPETLLPIAFTASSSSFWRRPVIKTYAPSLTKSFAVANPIPSVPPVMTATLPSSFLGIVFPCSFRVLTNLPRSDSFVLWESLSEHGSATFRLLFCRFILNDVPMLNKDSVLNAQNIYCNPIYRSTETAKSPVHDHAVSLCYDRSGFILQRWWDALDEIEQALTARCDMSAVLNVVRGPVALGRYVIPFVEQSVKGRKNDCLVLFLFSLAHRFFLSGKTVPYSLRVLRSSRSILPHIGKLLCYFIYPLRIERDMSSDLLDRRERILV